MVSYVLVDAAFVGHAIDVGIRYARGKTGGGCAWQPSLIATRPQAARD